MLSEEDRNRSHEVIYEQLLGFVQQNKVPNLLFYGPCKSGKKRLLKRLLADIYASHTDKMSTYLKIVNCAHTNGIQFVRDELKLFSKINLHHTENLFKSVVLLNADKLTIDSQSAIRRLIEVSNHSTRFFIVVEDKNKLLKPILSRFCDFYISLPFSSPPPSPSSSSSWLFDKIIDLTHKREKENTTPQQLMIEILDYADNLYQTGVSGLDLLGILEKTKEKEKYSLHNPLGYAYLCFVLHRLKIEIRNEKHFLFTILFLLILYFQMPPDSYQSYLQQILASLLI